MKYGCAVNGLIVRPGMGGSAMCSKIIVGGKFCGSDKECPHKTEICETCNGHGMVGGPSYYQPDEGGIECPDCTPSSNAELTGAARPVE